MLTLTVLSVTMFEEAGGLVEKIEVEQVRGLPDKIPWQISVTSHL